MAGFKRSTCQGIIDQQWGDAILPVISELLSEEVFCTYKFEVCNMNEYEEIDLKQIVFNELHKKTEEA